MRDPYMDGWHIGWMHSNLTWIGDLELLRKLARKTWPADPRDRAWWTPDELESVNAWYEDQQPSLVAPDEKQTSIDPFELELWNDEQSFGFGLDGLRYVMLVFLRSTWIDFVDSILERSKRRSARGSLSCIECGTFVGRRALGYGQLYCSDRCKKRAAKRRYRRRRSLAATGPGLRVVRLARGRWHFVHACGPGTSRRYRSEREHLLAAASRRCKSPHRDPGDQRAAASA